MAHEWHRGVLTASSWHGLEEIGVLPDADAMIAAGQVSGAWPVAVRFEDLFTAAGIKAGERAVVGSYVYDQDAVLGVVGGRYRATTPAEWSDLVRAATLAGAKPTGAFALRDGSRVLATFEVGEANGLRTQFVLVDSFDGSLSLRAGTTSIRVVCANTLRSSLAADGDGMPALRHTASLEERVKVLGESISEAIKTGDRVRDLYEAAKRTVLTRDEAATLFDALFPPAFMLATKRELTKARAMRDEARQAAAMPINNEGPTLATLWNAATYVVDREGTSPRPVRGGGSQLVVVIDESRNLPLSLDLNYPEFPDRCRGVVLLFVEDVLEVLVDRPDVLLEEVTKLSLREPDGSAVEANLDATPPVFALVEDDLGRRGRVESMVLGSRGERVNEVMTLIEVILRDGTVQTVTAPQALELGVDQQLVGRKVLAEIIEAYVPPAA